VLTIIIIKDPINIIITIIIIIEQCVYYRSHPVWRGRAGVQSDRALAQAPKKS
jgi:hypothetical protein